MKRRFRLVTCILLSACILTLLTGGVAFAADATAQPVTDYAQHGSWLMADTSQSKPVDIFYVYPTAYQRGKGDPAYCAIDNLSMVKGAIGALNRQAAAFLPVGNIYAPYYRQADAGYVLTMPSIADQDEAIRVIPAADCLAAFQYYLDNFNGGRPFILAGHSQGSNVLLYLLAEISQKPELLDKLVAAYVIGFSVTQAYLDQYTALRFATGATDTGVIISYNTEGAGVAQNPVVRPGALAINPITWTREETPAAKEQNAGSIRAISAIMADLTPIPALASARVDTARGVVVCDSVDPKQFALPGWPEGVYHSFDYPFYFYNIRENAQARVDAYLAAHP